MEQIVIHGGNKLFGKVAVSGSKNAALPILISTILVNDVSVIENLPNINDVKLTLEILDSMGAKIKMLDETTYEIDTRPVEYGSSPYDLVKKMRGSTYLIGAELGRFGKSKVGWPGGCDFGIRPIDQHIKGFQALGASVKVEGGYITADSDSLSGNSVYFDIVSVGATINAILASVMANGNTTIDNAAREPHVVDLANYLNSCGARISGAGTDVIRIRGVRRLWGSRYAIIPDMIEAGTYMISAAATGGTVEITNVIPKHLESISAKMQEMGIEVTELDESVIVRSCENMNAINVKTLPYPGFPTDMHPQMSVLLCFAQGVSHITENIFENRFRYAEELARMGAAISVNGKTASIEGRGRLVGAPVRAVDLRAGAAMIIAGLSAEGTTTITEIGSIQRGYDDIVGKLKNLGADIKLVGSVGEKFIS